MTWNVCSSKLSFYFLCWQLSTPHSPPPGQSPVHTLCPIAVRFWARSHQETFLISPQLWTHMDTHLHTHPTYFWRSREGRGGSLQLKTNSFPMNMVQNRVPFINHACIHSLEQQEFIESLLDATHGKVLDLPIAGLGMGETKHSPLPSMAFNRVEERRPWANDFQCELQEIFTATWIHWVGRMVASISQRMICLQQTAPVGTVVDLPKGYKGQEPAWLSYVKLSLRHRWAWPICSQNLLQVRHCVSTKDMWTVSPHPEDSQQAGNYSAINHPRLGSQRPGSRN